VVALPSAFCPGTRQSCQDFDPELNFLALPSAPAQALSKEIPKLPKNSLPSASRTGTRQRNSKTKVFIFAECPFEQTLGKEIAKKKLIFSSLRATLTGAWQRLHHV
jgi:hypothetical protein